MFAFSKALIFLCACIPPYQDYPVSYHRGDGSYLDCDFTDLIDREEIHTVFEIGSRDAKDAVALSQFYRCHVFAFECNPDAVEICKATIGDNPNVTLVPYGVWDSSGPRTFYRIPSGNIGASSFFPFNPYARNYFEILKEGLTQEEVTVPCIRLDEFIESNQIDPIDLLCMDVQGSSFQVLKSLGTHLQRVKYIILEVEVHPIYIGESLFPDVDKYLRAHGFKRRFPILLLHDLFGDLLYENMAH